MNDRRHFLKLVGSASLALGAVACLGCGPAGQTGSAPTGIINGGLAKNITLNSLAAVNGENVLLGRDAGGLYAMSAICTHAGCSIVDSGDVSPSGLVCGCHGSEFDANGNVTRGPASSPLTHFEVTLAGDGTIEINADKSVPASQRTPMPT